MNSPINHLPRNSLRRSPRQPTRGMSSPAIFACLLWCGYLLLCPFYFFESGQPQVADYVMLALFGWVMLFRGLVFPARAMPLVGSVALLVVYIVCINGTRFLQTGDADIAKYLLFYVFNLLAVITFLSLYEWIQRPLGTLTGVTVFASILLQVLLTQWSFNAQLSRATAFFNNPNQLGYFVTLLCSMFWIWSQSVQRRTTSLLAAEISLFLAAVFLVTTSLSRAGLVALGLVFVLRVLMRASAPLLAIGATIALVVPQFDLDISQSVRGRFAEKAKSVVDEYHYRGYDRIVNHPEYLLLGAGEGAYWRFHSEHPGELHSSLGTMLFCYGAVGLALFGRVFWLLARDCGVRSLLYFAPVAAYGLTHNGLRQTEFWLMFAMMVCLHARAAATQRAAGFRGQRSQARVGPRHPPLQSQHAARTPR
jgi:hypothetical protein